MGADAWEAGQFESSRYFTDFMSVNGFRYAAAAPLAAPVFEGYPGAIHLYRTADQGAFNSEDLATLKYELESFVCDGEYLNGMRRILQAYRDSFDGSEQKAAWIKAKATIDLADLDENLDDDNKADEDQSAS